MSDSVDKKQELEHWIKSNRSAILVINTRSRRGQRLFPAARNELGKRGFTVDACYPIQYPERLPEVVKEVIQQGHKLVVVGGGDGTISSVVKYFAYQNAVLGLLPLGTANSFARSLGIPMDLKGAIDTIAYGKVADVDLGKIDQEYFSNVVAIGFAAEIARQIPHKLKKYTGVLAYGLMGLKLFLSQRPFECTIKTGENVHKVKSHQVAVINGDCFGIVKFAPCASADDRELIVIIFDTPSRWQMLKLWIYLLSNKASGLTEARFIRAKEVMLDAAPSQYIEVDGEIVMKTPAYISLAPEALNVMAPIDSSIS